MPAEAKTWKCVCGLVNSVGFERCPNCYYPQSRTKAIPTLAPEQIEFIEWMFDENENLGLDRSTRDKELWNLEIEGEFNLLDIQQLFEYWLLNVKGK